jgi:sugar lactone lactonase YvrE
VTPVLDIGRARVFFDGIFSDPRLSHPEGIAIGPDGWIWVGNQDGDLCRIAPDGSAIERVASTGGFALGLAFDGARALYACDLRHAAVFRLDLATRALTRLCAEGLRVPNWPVVDAARGRLLVSDSLGEGRAGPGIWAFPLGGGAGRVWDDRPLSFANGMALDGDRLLVAETFARRVWELRLAPDGSPGSRRLLAEDLPGLPDGLALDRARNLVVSLYEPSRILRLSPAGELRVLIEDATAHVLAHPTNVAFAGERLYAANLGRWHVTEIAVDIGAEPLWRASA